MHEADWVVVGPGSWFTSVMPNLLVPELFAALHSTERPPDPDAQPRAAAGETDGLTPAQHLDVLVGHAPDLRLDAVLVDQASLHATAERGDLDAAAGGSAPRSSSPTSGPADGSPRHDVLRLAAAYLDMRVWRDTTVDAAWQDRRHGDDGPGEG